MIDTKELRRLAQAATPGPWKIGQYLGSLRQFVIHTDVGDKGRGSDVAFTSAAFDNDETVANARLIAAAPDLLAALDALLLRYVMAIGNEGIECHQARAAIRKATGEAMTPTETAAILRQFNEWRRDFEDKFEQPDAREISEAIDAAIEMIDRLESAESDAFEQARLNGMGASREAALMAKLEAAEKSDAESFAMYRKARDERDELRAKIETAENDAAHQKALAASALRVAERWEESATSCAPRSSAWRIRNRLQQSESTLSTEILASILSPAFTIYITTTSSTPSPAQKENEMKLSEKSTQAMLEGQVRGFSDAYQGAMEEVAIWKRRALEAETLNRKFIAGINGPMHMGEPAQPAPSIPEGWLRAIDEALIVAHIGVANESDTYEQAKAKLDNLIGFHVDVATDPAVNGGWKLVPLEPTYEMLEAGEGARVPTYTDTPVSVPFDVYRAMLEAAPEAKP